MWTIIMEGWNRSSTVGRKYTLGPGIDGKNLSKQETNLPRTDLRFSEHLGGGGGGRNLHFPGNGGIKRKICVSFYTSPSQFQPFTPLSQCPSNP